MNTLKLFQASKNFVKSAQAVAPGAQSGAKAKVNPFKKMDPEKAKAINLWSNTLFAGVRGTASILRNPNVARKWFDTIAAYRKQPGYTMPAEIRELEALHTALDYAEEKLRGLGFDPIEVLKQKGMQNLNANTISTLKNNLATLLAGQDFSKYQHYYLLTPGAVHPKDVIEIDDYIAHEKLKNDPGY